MLLAYREHVVERAKLGVVAKPLSPEQVTSLTQLLINPPPGEEHFLFDLIAQRVPSGVDEAAKVKAEFLADLVKGNIKSPVINPAQALDLLGTMQGGYNIAPLIDALDDPDLAPIAVKALSFTLLVFERFNDVVEKARAGNTHAGEVLQSWANADWFTYRPAVAEKITLTVFKVTGETNTDDLSPAPEAWSRPDIPLHAQAMLRIPRDGVVPDKPDVIGPVSQISQLKEKGYPLAYVGDVVGTGSSRKSATNSLIWFMGEDIPFVPNKRVGGVILGGKIAPIFFNTMRDSGALPIELDVSMLTMGDVIDLYPYNGEIRDHQTHALITRFNLKTDVLLDEVRAGGRIPLIIGRALTNKARSVLNLNKSELFRQPQPVAACNQGYTLAQKIVGKACGVEGIRPGQYCEPLISSVGSQDTTGGMTRDELKDLACLRFSAELVMQSFCHTSAYPKPVDIELQKTLPQFFEQRGGIALRTGDGIIHSWLNRMILPDTLGTGGDSHTRFPIGLSFPAGSGLVAFAAATGIMPLDMPESVLVRFKGEMQPGITLRDLVHAIPYYAIEQGLLTVEKKGKKNIFSGRILEIEGLSNLSVEQAFELADASAERSAAACTIQLNHQPVIDYLTSNVALLKQMLLDGYQDRETINLRIKAMEQWLANPELLTADHDAQYAAVIEIDLTQLTEPVLCAPNDPDDVRLLSQVSGHKIDEVFIGSCMTNIGHFRAAATILQQQNAILPTRLWLAPPTRMDAEKLKAEGLYSVYARVGARIEPTGCSLCMGNQARTAVGANVVSTSTRNFPHRLGTDAQVFLASAELAAIAGVLGRIPSLPEYLGYMQKVMENSEQIYSYLDFSNTSANQRIL